MTQGSATLLANGVEDKNSLPLPNENTELLGHEEAEKAILKDINSARLPHAIMLTGDRGIGKATFAYRIARYLLAGKAEQTASGGLFGDEVTNNDSLFVDVSDRVAQKITAKSHPDLKIIEPTNISKDGKEKATDTISVEYARDIPIFLSHTAAEGGWRVVVVDDADKMNSNAQNAILKILEEPPEKSILILTTAEAGKIIPTIHSRCQMIKLNSLSDEVMTELLTKAEIDKKIQTDLIKIAKGSIGKALLIYKLDGIEMYKKIEEIIVGKNSLDKYKFAETLTKDTEKYNLFMQILLNYIADILKQTTIENSLHAGRDKYKWFDIFEEISNLYKMAETKYLDKKATMVQILNILG